MQDDTIFAHPLRRRWWLITKALESAALDDALKIAQAVDKFLTSGDVEGLDQQISQIYMSGKAGEVEVSCSAMAGLTEIVVSREPAEPSDAAESLPQAEVIEELVAAEEPAHERASAGTAAWRHPEPENDRDGVADSISNLAVWASIDDVVRYLRQRDDVVVPNGDGQFLVNGRFSEDTTTLVARANKVRQRHHKPPFQLVPNGFAAAE